MPIKVEIAVAISDGTIIKPVLSAPFSLKSCIAEVGKSCKEVAEITNSIFLACSLFSSSKFLSASMA